MPSLPLGGLPPRGAARKGPFVYDVVICDDTGAYIRSVRVVTSDLQSAVSIMRARVSNGEIVTSINTNMDVEVIVDSAVISGVDCNAKRP